MTLQIPSIKRITKNKCNHQKNNFEWIDKGRIFKRIRPIENYIALRKNNECCNKHKVQDYWDEMQNNNSIAHNISLDIKLQNIKEKNKDVSNEIKY